MDTDEPESMVKTIKVSESWFEKHPETSVQCLNCKAQIRVIVSICTVASCPNCGKMNTFEFEIA